jgi:large subunit ribosomal protein L21
MSERKFAIVDIFGRQFKVSEGDKIKANLVQANPGEKITLSNVYMLNKGAQVQVGAPTIAGARVVAEVVEHGRDDKIIVSKYLRKNKSKKMRGHRQPFTTLTIKSIEG